jgi:hypothetical protein
MTTVSELREILVESGQYTQEEAAACKGKGSLQQLVDNLSFATAELNDCQFEEINQEDTSKPDMEELPDYNAVEWQDYVMSFFTDEELVDGRPTCVGLRRVAELLLGEVAFSKPVDCNSQQGIAWVRWEMGIYFRMGTPNYHDFNIQELPLRIFGACADANFDNTKNPYNNYLTAVADTRAEARCLRKALRIEVIAAEEVSTDDDTNNKDMKITQLSAITRQCNRLEILPKDVYAVLDFTEPLSYADAAVVVRTLREYLANPDSIPAEIRK